MPKGGSIAYSFAISRGLDATVWGAGAYGFNNTSNLVANVAGVGLFTAVPDKNFAWGEYGARVGYAITNATTFDVFADSVSGEK